MRNDIKTLLKAMVKECDDENSRFESVDSESSVSTRSIYTTVPGEVTVGGKDSKDLSTDKLERMNEAWDKEDGLSYRSV